MTASIREGQGKIFSEDLEMLERQQQNLLSHPARNLFTGDVGLDGGRMGRCTIARHLITGPRSAPRNVPSGQKLPGGIAMSFADAHVEMVRLENLWQQYWNNHYEPPTVRPP